ncbi:MAG: adenosylcobinamide-GDP ribazoletransferase [Betaproteobacteria bacterium]|nr:adenosylcobinamide-GDP ribazoletransferase [Betaproteobacteria bacterium]
MDAILIAAQFLTILPLQPKQSPTEEAIGRSLSFYPLIGLLLGLVLVAGARIFRHEDALLVAAILLAIWTLLTGALHLDGLADCVDAWVGGRDDRTRTLAIMKDPASGPMGVTAIVIVLLLKFAMLATLCVHGALVPIALAPLLGRAAVQALLLTTPYVRVNGLGAALAAHLRRRELLVALILTGVGTWLAAGNAAVAVLLAAGGVLAVFRRAILQRIGGTTGDTAGALVELVEVSVLIVFCLIPAS